MSTYSAGIMVYDSNGRVLLGLQRGYWSSFSGKSEYGETPRETARRELNEETLYTMKNEMASEKLDSVMISETPRGNFFYMFFMRFEGDGTHVKQRFQDNRTSKEYCDIAGCDETQRLSWFSRKDIHKIRIRPSLVKDMNYIFRIIDHELESRGRGKKPFFASTHECHCGKTLTRGIGRVDKE